MRRFAMIEFVNELSEVPIKFNVLKKAPSFILDWYIKKFNPFTMEKIEMFEAEGFTVKLPITKPIAESDLDYFADIYNRTLNCLADYDVEIVLPPRNFKIVDSGFKVERAQAQTVFPFFIMQAINKSLKIFKKDIKTAELVIIDGNRNLTLNLLDNIYPHVNFLTVITNSEDISSYDRTAEEILDDTGLNLNVSGYNKTVLTNADIIINTSEENEKFDHYYKRGAIYFELSKSNCIDLLSKREDMLIIDDLRLKLGTEFLSLEELDCWLHIKCREYRALKNRAYESYLMKRVFEFANGTGFEISSLCVNHKVLNSVSLTRILSRAGVIGGPR